MAFQEVSLSPVWVKNAKSWGVAEGEKVPLSPAAFELKLYSLENFV